MVGYVKEMAEVNVPFLFTIQKLNNTIFGYNSIKHLVQNRNDIESISFIPNSI